MEHDASTRSAALPLRSSAYTSTCACLTPTARRPWPEADIGCDDKTRFTIELEMAQCLANPHYLNWLAQNRYLEDQAFIHYLKYLQYWRRPEYSRFVRYPHALFMLDMLQSEEFRKALANPKVAEEIHQQQFYFWQHYRTQTGRDPSSQKPVEPTVAAG